METRWKTQQERKYHAKNRQFQAIEKQNNQTFRQVIVIQTVRKRLTQNLPSRINQTLFTHQPISP